ncbi:MAG: hypothetical protein IJN02_02385 [Bacteroidales bacterium]|nr:hypothetical protein [Bacteroidales bacterium]
MMEFRLKDIDWKAVSGAIIETFRSIGRGDILLRMRVDKLFPFILYTFALAWVSIWLTYKSDQTMLKAEQNKERIKELKISYAKKTCDIAGLSRISTIESLLKESGSEVKAPEKPADRLVD